MTGIITTLVNIYGSQGGRLSSTAKANLALTVVTFVSNFALWVYYSVWKLRPLKKEHLQQALSEMQPFDTEKDGAQLKDAIVQEPELGTQAANNTSSNGNSGIRSLGNEVVGKMVEGVTDALT